jgi:hypothetical protein
MVLCGCVFKGELPMDAWIDTGDLSDLQGQGLRNWGGIPASAFGID